MPAWLHRPRAGVLTSFQRAALDGIEGMDLVATWWVRDAT